MSNYKTQNLYPVHDASPYGVGAVLSQMNPNKEEKPIAFASRFLAPAECKYSQLDKELFSQKVPPQTSSTQFC